MSRVEQKKEWVPWAGLFLAVAGIVYQGGQITGEVNRSTERISKLEASEEARTDAISAMNVRTARIEAKLDFLMEQRKPK
ncbi:hypothetical protein ABC347_07710 [Sphingomonas sp. 1P06PA]|uniref:hypothetical protein n=1 Tax=Sphingomonas sp. 1P06PA TaxID=554121 RepID=UPI0039A4769D